MKRIFLLAAAGSLILLSPHAAQAVDVFTLEEHVPDLGNPITSAPTITGSGPSGITATLSQFNLGSGSFGNVIGFEYADNTNNTQVSYGTNLNNVVITDAQDGSALDTLVLTFSQPLSDLTFSFATTPLIPGALIPLFATTDNPTVFTSGTGSFNAVSQDNEGSLFLTGGTFTTLSIFLGGTARAGEVFAVDNFLVTPAAPAPVPEPGSVALLLGIGLPVAWKLRRGRQNGRRTC